MPIAHSCRLDTPGLKGPRDGYHRGSLSNMIDTKLDEAKRIMGSLVRMPLKPHDDMKLDKPRRKKANSPTSQGLFFQLI
jgi:hypothetical protein